MRHSLLTAVFLVCCAGLGWAQQPDTTYNDTTVIRIPEIVAGVVRPIITSGGASALELRLDSLRSQAAPTLEQVLREMPLVQVRTNSRGEAQFSLRGSGSDARQVAVLVDGVPVNLGWDGRADLSVLPATAARNLTLARGLPSMLHGPNVLGGVIELDVARGPQLALDPRSLRLDVGIDHTGARSYASTITLPGQSDNAEFLLRAGVGRRVRDGVALPAGVVEQTTAARRLNTDLSHTDAFAALRYQSQNGAWASLSASAFEASRGIPAELHIANPRYWRYPELRRGLAVMSAGTGDRKSPFGGQGDVEASIGLDVGHTKTDQYATQAYQDVIGEEDADDRTHTFRLLADQSVGARGELRAALTYADIHHDEVLTPGERASYRQRLWSSAAEMGWRLGGKLSGTRISIGTALDAADTPESGDKPELGRLWQWGGRAGFSSLIAGGRVLVHGGATRRARFPALRELYSGALGRFEPNPDLEAEKLLAMEAGATMKLAGGEVQGVVFHRSLYDAIVRISTPDRKFKRVNREREGTNGVELLAAAQLGRLTLRGDLTLQQSTPTDIEYQPTVIGGATVSALMPLDFIFDAAVKYVGEQSCINPESAQLNRLRPSTRLDTELARGWRMRAGWFSQIEASIAADNLADRPIYDQCGLPQPGRTLRMQVRVR